MADYKYKEGPVLWDGENKSPAERENWSSDNDYKLKSIEIVSPSGGKVDLSNVFTSFKMFEDLFSNTISCTLSFNDANNVCRHLPIIGQREKLTAKWQIKGDDEVVLEFDIYSVGTKNISDVGKRESITLKGVSSEQFKNIHTRVSKSFYKKIDEMVSDIFDEHLKDSGSSEQHKLNIDVKTDSEKRKFIIPNWHPFDAINWLADRSQGEENSDACHFIFYQDRKGFHFTTIEKLFEEKTPKMSYLYSPRKFRENPLGFRDAGFVFRNIERLIVDVPGDRLDENIQGMYGSKILTHDIVRKKYEFKEFSMKDEFDNTKHVPQPDTESYPIAKALDEFSSEPDTFWNFCPIHKNLNQENELNGGDTVEKNEKYSEWLLKRKSLMRQVGGMVINVEVSGDSRRKCGDVVHLRISPTQPGTKEDEELDKYITGNYLVTSIKHNLTPDGYIMNMELSKDNQNEAYPSSSSFKVDDNGYVL